MSEKKLRGKPRVQVYAYGNDGMCRKFDSISQAALTMGEQPATLRNAAVDCRIARSGYLYSFKQLTVGEVTKKFEERDKKIASYKKNQPKERANTNCKEFIGSQEFEVDCFSRNIFHIEKNRQGRVKQLEMFLYHTLDDRWQKIPIKVANLERRFLKEILESLT